MVNVSILGEQSCPPEADPPLADSEKLYDLSYHSLRATPANAAHSIFWSLREKRRDAQSCNDSMAIARRRVCLPASMDLEGQAGHFA